MCSPAFLKGHFPQDCTICMIFMKEIGSFVMEVYVFKNMQLPLVISGEKLCMWSQLYCHRVEKSAKHHWYMSFSAFHWYNIWFSAVHCYNMSFSVVHWYNIFSAVHWYNMSFSGVHWYNISFSVVHWYNMSFSVVHCYNMSFSVVTLGCDAGWQWPV